MASFGWDPSPLDIYFSQGEDFVMPVQLKNPDGSFINLTGCEMKMQIRHRAGSTPIYGDFQTPPGFGILITDPLNGIFKITIPKSITTFIPPGEDGFDLFITDSAGETHPYFTGAVTVTPSITRPSK